MDKYEFLELIFKSIKDTITSTNDIVKIASVHCSGVNVTFTDQNNNTYNYAITVSQKL